MDLYVVGEERLELSRLATHGPEPCPSTNFGIRPCGAPTLY
jgi:hypothetical protein